MIPLTSIQRLVRKPAFFFTLSPYLSFINIYYNSFFHLLLQIIITITITEIRLKIQEDLQYISKLMMTRDWSVI